MTWIHPTQFILILETEDDIWEDDEDGHDPAKNAQEDQECLLLNKGLDKNHPEECSLSQHPAVGGHHEVGGEDMETSAPDSVTGPYLSVKQNQIIPYYPSHVVKSNRHKHVCMNGNSDAVKRSIIIS